MVVLLLREHQFCPVILPYAIFLQLLLLSLELALSDLSSSDIITLCTSHSAITTAILQVHGRVQQLPLFVVSYNSLNFYDYDRQKQILHMNISTSLLVYLVLPGARYYHYED